MILKTDLLQQALQELVPDFPNWYAWAKVDSDGHKIPSDQRMQTKYVVVEETHIGKVQRPTDETIQAKITELKNAEPIRLLREKRNQRLSETDWRDLPSYPGTDQNDWRTYRQALRDLPSTAKPQLDEQGNLTNVTWPTKPE